MAGRKTIETHIAPRISRAAEAAGRPAPRICVGLPICVTDDRQEAFEAAAGFFARYSDLPSYRRMLDIEGVESPAEVAVIGNDAEVEAQLRDLAQAGATDFLASMFPAGDDPQGSEARTRALLKRLVGNI
jgi:alkanesulfonate monooxygenase SsuD/methylene tetrahydromethanopterin reductase-like flavin-dependent oxidoreductase (luciferase family)